MALFDTATNVRLELNDCIIAASAIKFNQVLVTRNARHYPDERLSLYVPDYPLSPLKNTLKRKKYGTVKNLDNIVNAFSFSI